MPYTQTVSKSYCYLPNISQILNIYIGPLHGVCVWIRPTKEEMEFYFPIDLANLVSIACSSPPRLCPSPSGLSPHGKQESCLLHSLADSTHMSSYVLAWKRNHRMDSLHQYLSLPQTYNHLEGVCEFFIFTIILVPATQGNKSKVDFPWSYWTLSFRAPRLLRLR